MKTVTVRTTPLTPNGINCVIRAYEEKLTVREKFMIWKNKLNYTKKIIIDAGVPQYIEITFSLVNAETVNDRVLESSILEINNRLLASKGAWKEDFRTEVKIND